MTCLLKKKLQITQNKVISFTLGLPSRSHIGPTEFSGANMLPMPLRVDQVIHMYSIINGIAPSYLKSEIAIADHTGHVTRSGNRGCFVPRVNSFAIKSFFYTGIKQWNALPSATQLISNKQAFKSEVKKLLWMKKYTLFINTLVPGNAHVRFCESWSMCRMTRPCVHVFIVLLFHTSDRFVPPRGYFDKSRLFQTIYAKA